MEVLKIALDGEKDITVTSESLIIHATVLDELSTYLRTPYRFHKVEFMGELLTAFMAHPKAVEKLLDDLMLLPKHVLFKISFPRTLPSSVEPRMIRLLSKYTQQIMSNGPKWVAIQKLGGYNRPHILFNGRRFISFEFVFSDALGESTDAQPYDRIVQETFSFTSSASASPGNSTNIHWYYPEASNEAFTRMIHCSSISDLTLSTSSRAVSHQEPISYTVFPQDHIDILKNAFSPTRKRKQQHTTAAAAAGVVTPSRAFSSCQSNVSVLRLKHIVFDEPRFASMCQVLQDSTNLVELEIDGVMLSSHNIDASTIWQHILGILHYNKALQRMAVLSISDSYDIGPLHPLVDLQGKQADDAKSSLINVLEHHTDSLIFLSLDPSSGFHFDDNERQRIGDLLDLNRYGLKAFRTSTGFDSGKVAFLRALVHAVEVAEQGEGTKILFLGKVAVRDEEPLFHPPENRFLSCLVNLFQSNPMLVDFLGGMTD